MTGYQFCYYVAFTFQQDGRTEVSTLDMGMEKPINTRQDLRGAYERIDALGYRNVRIIAFSRYDERRVAG